MTDFQAVYAIGLILMVISVGAYISNKIPDEWFRK